MDEHNLHYVVFNNGALLQQTQFYILHYSTIIEEYQVISREKCEKLKIDEI